MSIGVMKSPEMDHADTYRKVIEFPGVMLIRLLVNGSILQFENG
jgi:hypothetical protein